MTTPIENTIDDDTDVSDVDDTVTNDWTPPTQEDYEQLVARERKANAESAARKRYLKEHGIDHLTGKKQTDDSDTADTAVPVDTAAIETAAASKAEAVFTALADAGVAPQSLSRFSRMVDRNGDIAAQVETLKAEFGELFTKRPRTTNAVDATAVGAGKKQAPAADQTKDYAQVLADRVLGL